MPEPKSGSGEAPILQPHGALTDSRAHINHPFRDLHKGGHDLNESYKVPAANAQNKNHSYAHPIEHPDPRFTGKENSPKILQPGMPAFVTGKDKGQSAGAGQSNQGKTIGGGAGPAGSNKPDKI